MQSNALVSSEQVRFKQTMIIQQSNCKKISKLEMRGTA